MARNFRRNFSKEKEIETNNIKNPENSLPSKPRHRQSDDGSGKELLQKLLNEKNESDSQKIDSEKSNETVAPDSLGQNRKEIKGYTTYSSENIDTFNDTNKRDDEVLEVDSFNDKIETPLSQENSSFPEDNETILYPDEKEVVVEEKTDVFEINDNNDNNNNNDDNNVNGFDKEVDNTENENFELSDKTEKVFNNTEKGIDNNDDGLAEDTEVLEVEKSISPNPEYDDTALFTTGYQEEKTIEPLTSNTNDDESEVDIIAESDNDYDFDPREEVNKRTGIGTKVAVGITSAIAIALLGGAAYYTFVSDNSPISIDSSANKITVPQASEELSYNDNDPCEAFENLNCNVEWVFDNSPKGTFLSQSIEPGSSVDIDSAITLTYSKNSENVEIPNVIGLSENDAKEALYQAGLNITQVSRVSANGEQAGTVIRLENAEPGNVVANDSEVSVIVADGTINIPDWTGKTKEFVQAEASNMGIKPVFREEESDAPAGTVISQSIKEQQVSTGDSIEVVIAKNFAAQKKSIPDVVAMNPTEASAKLAEEGFRKITTVVVSNNEVTREQVTQIVPGADTEADLDQDITLIISKPIENSEINRESEPPASPEDN